MCLFFYVDELSSLEDTVGQKDTEIGVTMAWTANEVAGVLLSDYHAHGSMIPSDVISSFHIGVRTVVQGIRVVWELQKDGGRHHASCRQIPAVTVMQLKCWKGGTRNVRKKR